MKMEEKKFCKHCYLTEDIAPRFREVINSYIEALDDEAKVDETTYLKRLELCKACAYKVGETCSLCGCFVRIRAVKKGLRCPDYPNNRW